MASKGDIEISANIKSNVGQLTKDVDPIHENIIRDSNELATIIYSNC